MKWIALGITLAIASLVGFFIWRHSRAVETFSLPDWDDVELGGSVPKSIAWTCHRERPDEPETCKGQRPVPMENITVQHRPDLGVIGITTTDVKRETGNELRKRWGKPTKERTTRDRVGTVSVKVVAAR